MTIRLLLISIIGIGAIMIIIGIYIALKPDPQQTQIQTASTYTQPTVQSTRPISDMPGWSLINSGEIPVDRPFIDVGTYEGEILILMTGKAQISFKLDPVDPDGLKNQPAEAVYPLPGAPTFCSIGRINGKITFIGKRKEIYLNSPTNIELGVNDEPGKAGEGFRDNKGSWTYKIYKSAQ